MVKIAKIPNLTEKKTLVRVCITKTCRFESERRQTRWLGSDSKISKRKIPTILTLGLPFPSKIMKNNLPRLRWST
jgi:hypothetical protein